MAASAEPRGSIHASPNLVTDVVVLFLMVRLEYGTLLNSDVLVGSPVIASGNGVGRVAAAPRCLEFSAHLVDCFVWLVWM